MPKKVKTEEFVMRRDKETTNKVRFKDIRLAENENPFAKASLGVIYLYKKDWGLVNAVRVTIEEIPEFDPIFGLNSPFTIVETDDSDSINDTPSTRTDLYIDNV